MHLDVLGSGSSGNCYVLTEGKDTLILECGVAIKEVKKALNFDYSNNIFCLISHQDKDHCKYVKEITEMGIDVYCLKETADSFGFKSHRIHYVETGKKLTIGGFSILGFPLIHDVPILGYLLEYKGNTILFATDTHYIPYKFPGLTNIMIEANFSNDILDEKLTSGRANMFVRNRVLFSHMDIDTTLDFLKANDLSKVNNIVLLHLSDGNSNAADFQKRVQEATGKSVFAAQSGLNIPFNKTAF